MQLYFEYTPLKGGKPNEMRSTIKKPQWLMDGSILSRTVP